MAAVATAIEMSNEYNKLVTSVVDVHNNSIVPYIFPQINFFHKTQEEI